MDHWEVVLPPGRIMRVPYESLVTNQEAMTRRILAFVGLEWEPGVLQFHETIRSVQTASLGQVSWPLSTLNQRDGFVTLVETLLSAQAMAE